MSVPNGHVRARVYGTCTWATPSNTVQHLKTSSWRRGSKTVLPSGLSVQTVICTVTFAHSIEAPGLLVQHKSLKQQWSLSSGDPQTVGFFPAVDCCCCRYVGLFTLGFLRLGLLFAFVSWTTKKDRTTIAPKKANTGMVWPTSWLYRPGIIPEETGAVVKAQRHITIITKSSGHRGGFKIHHQILHTLEGENL